MKKYDIDLLNRRNTYTCPFLKGAGPKHGVIYCEGKHCKPFRDKDELKEYTAQYCANGANGWKNCETAKMLLESYQRKDAVWNELRALKRQRETKTQA